MIVELRQHGTLASYLYKHLNPRQGCTDTAHVDTVLVVEYGLFVPTPGYFEPPSAPPPAPTFNFSDPIEGLGGRPTTVSVGKAVGGSSAVNGQFFDRGSRWDYDDWEKLLALEEGERDISWDWEALLPFFRKVSQLIIHLDLFHPCSM
jgi:choline dehydrogenase